MVKSADASLPNTVRRRSAMGGRLRLPFVAASLMLGDLLILSVVLLIAIRLTGMLAGHPVPTQQLRDIAFGFLAFPLACNLSGLYPGYGLTGVERFRRRVLATVIPFALLSVWSALAAQSGPEADVLILAMILGVPALLGGDAFIRRRLADTRWWGLRCAVVGVGRRGQAIIRALQQKPMLGITPLYAVDVGAVGIGAVGIGAVGIGTVGIGAGPDRGTPPDPVAGPDIEVLSGLGPLHHLADRLDMVIVAMPDIEPAVIEKLSRHQPNTRIILVPEATDPQSLWIEPRDLNGILGLEAHRNLLRRRNRILKRLLDLIVGMPVFIVTLPLVGLCILAIRAANPGPALFAQERIGRHGRTIRIYKLRTMYCAAETLLEAHLASDPAARAEWTHHFKLVRDPRILPGIGHILRRTSLDELPQLWNVLRGEMSLVGPRPLPLYHLTAYDEAFRHLRQEVPPGLTGLWQISTRSDGDLRALERLDSYYIHNWSIWFDLYIILCTGVAVLTGKGAC